MADAITIDNTKEQQLELEMTVQGVDDTKETKLCFLIELDNMYLGFEAEKGEGNAWKVNLPKLPMLERTTYDYKIVVVSDGYYFEPASGLVTVVGPRDIYTSEPKNVTVKPKPKEANEKEPEKDSKKKSETKSKGKEKKEEKKVNEYLRAREKPIEQVARELMAQKDFDPSKPKFSALLTEDAQPVAPEPDSKDAKVLEILKQSGYTPRKRQRFSFRH